MEQASRRTWADIVVIVVSLWTVGQAIWGPMIFSQASQDAGASATWLASLVAGGLAIAGMIVSQKRINLGRGLVALAAGLIFIAPFTYQRMAPIPMTFAIVSGVLLAAAAKFIGPLPVPGAAAPRAPGPRTS